MPVCGIYKIECLADGKIYIGQAIDIKHRWIEHQSDLNRGKHHNFHLQRAWDKYGSSAFKFEVLEELPEDPELLYQRELYWMNKYRSLDRKHGFNIAKGFNSYFALSEERKQEIKEKLREALSGNKNPNYGKKMSAEQRSKISESRKGMPSPNRGKAWPKEVREKISMALKGKKHPYYGKSRPNHSLKMSGGNNPRARKVLCITTGEVFACAKDAGKKYGITNSVILKCCKGIHKYAGRLSDGTKLMWKYIDE